jgi:hypothetical protein
MQMKTQQKSVLLFDRHKYTWLIIGLAITAIGFILMIGGGSKDPAVFNDNIFNFQRLTLSPILVLAGYIIQFYAIMKKTTNTADEPSIKRTQPATRKEKPQRQVKKRT